MPAHFNTYAYTHTLALVRRENSLNWQRNSFYVMHSDTNLLRFYANVLLSSIPNIRSVVQLYFKIGHSDFAMYICTKNGYIGTYYTQDRCKGKTISWKNSNEIVKPSASTSRVLGAHWKFEFRVHNVRS